MKREIENPKLMDRGKLATEISKRVKVRETTRENIKRIKIDLTCSKEGEGERDAEAKGHTSFIG